MNPLANRVAARFQKKKEVPKADGSGTTTVYEYGPRQVSNRNRAKASRIEKLRSQMAGLRARYKKDLSDSDPKKRLSALAVALIDLTYERVGNDGSAKDNGHYGVTTWQADHVSVKGSKATFTYTGKSGVEQKKVVSDSKVVTALKRALKGKSKSDRILCEGDDCKVKALDVNTYLKEFKITAKDIRGLHANEEMRKALREVRSKGPALPKDRKAKDKILKAEFKAALEKASSAVGHEASTLKNQYLVPGMETSFLHDGKVLDKLNKKARTASEEEVFKLWKLLDDIDTASDIAKGDDAMYRNLVERYQAKRRDVVPEERVEALYDQFFKWDTEKRAGQMIQGLGLPRVVRLLEASGLDPWDTTHLPYGALSVREAAVASVAEHLEGRSDESRWAVFASRVGTKSDSEVEDEESERLVRQSPKKRPPRTDLERGRIENKADRDEDPDEKADRKDRSNNYKDASSRLAQRYLLSRVSPTDSGKFKAERPDSEVPQYFEKKEEAEAWVAGEDASKEEDGKDSPSKADAPSKADVAKAEASERKAVLDSVASALSGAAAKKLRKTLEGYAPDQIKVFAEAMVAEKGHLAETGASGGMGKFQASAAASRKMLDKPSGEESPEDLAKALAVVEYHDKVVDNPLAETDPAVGKVPDAGDPVTEAGKLKSIQEAAAARAFHAVGKYRQMDAAGRKSHAQKIQKEINSLPEGSERRLHLEGMQKGIGLAGALEDGEKATGVGATVARLTRAAEKGGSLKALLSLGSVNSKDPASPDDQQVLRQVYEELDGDEWSEVLEEGHPGKALADLLSDDEQGKYLTEDDKTFIKNQLLDMMVAEAGFLDSYANRTLDEGATVGEKGAAVKAKRAEAAPERKMDLDFSEGSPKDKLKELGSWIADMLKSMGSANTEKALPSEPKAPKAPEPEKAPEPDPEPDPEAEEEKAPEPEPEVEEEPEPEPEAEEEKAPEPEAEEEHEAGTVWGKKPKLYAKNPDGEQGGPFKSMNQARKWSQGEVASDKDKAQAKKTLKQQQKSKSRKKRGGLDIHPLGWDFNPWPKL